MGHSAVNPLKKPTGSFHIRLFQSDYSIINKDMKNQKNGQNVTEEWITALSKLRIELNHIDLEFMQLITLWKSFQLDLDDVLIENSEFLKDGLN